MDTLEALRLINIFQLQIARMLLKLDPDLQPLSIP